MFSEAAVDVLEVEHVIIAELIVVVRMNVSVKPLVVAFTAHENVVYFCFCVKIEIFIVDAVFSSIIFLRYHSYYVAFDSYRTHVFLNADTLVAFNEIVAVHVFVCYYRITLTVLAK